VCKSGIIQYGDRCVKYVATTRPKTITKNVSVENTGGNNSFFVIYNNDDLNFVTSTSPLASVKVNLALSKFFSSIVMHETNIYIYIYIVSIIKNESKELNISKNRVFIFSTNTILDIKINLDLHIIDYCR